MLWKWWLQSTKILGDVSDYHFSLWNVGNYQFRSLFNIGNTPSKNRRSVGTKTFSTVIKIFRVIWQLFNAWREIIVAPYSWAVDSPLISCQVRCRLIKVCILSSFNVMNLWIYCKLVFVFIINIIRESMYWGIKRNILNFLNKFLHETSYLQLIIILSSFAA